MRIDLRSRSEVEPWRGNSLNTRACDSFIRTPFRAPNCNAYAKRSVRSIKEECLARVILVGERHFRRTIAEFVAHYHAERNHQGIGNELIQPLERANSQGRVRRRQRIGGMLNYYYRAA